MSYTNKQVIEVLRQMEQTQLVDLIVDTILPYVPARSKQAAMHEIITSDKQCEQNVIAFVNKCIDLSGDQIYKLFSRGENFIREDVFRYVQCIMGVRTQDMDEPTRQTMIQLGLKFGVQSLIDY